MHLRTAISLISATVLGGGASAQTLTTGKLGNATVVSNNPAGAIYTATLPDTAFTKSAYPNGGNVKGSVFAVSSPDGTGVMYKVQFFNLPSEGGPFLYHLHDSPVSSDGNCTKTLAHLDPFQRGEDVPCNSSFPETCQVGDLSGKYGKVDSDPFTATYTDNYSALVPGIGAFFGNRSFVIHFANKTRISCANFTAVSTGSSGTCTGTGSSSTPTSSSTPVSPGPVKSNTTTTGSIPSSTFVQSAGNANLPPAIMMLSAGFAVFAFLL